MVEESLFAADHHIRIDSEQDALDAMAIPVAGLIFRIEDVSPDFFELSNGLAGAVFQKFMNYNRRAVFIVPAVHALGPRIIELAREHARHSHIRILPSETEALVWLRSF